MVGADFLIDELDLVCHLAPYSSAISSSLGRLKGLRKMSSDMTPELKSKLDSESRSSEYESEIHVDEEAERRAVRKLDLTLLPIITMFYFLSFLVSSINTFPFKYSNQSRVGPLQYRYLDYYLRVWHLTDIHDQAMRKLQVLRRASS